MITLKEIAAEAGVSVMTVSNVIHNKTARVSEKNAQRIRDIIEKNNYQPNMAARSLISKESRIVAVLLPLWRETAASLLHDPYAGRLAGYLESMLREHGYYVMLVSFKTVEEAVQVQRTWQVDGSILLLPHEDPITFELVERTVSPLVVIDRRFDKLQMRSVLLDDYKGGYLAAKHLIDYGHRKIGFAAPTLQDSKVIRERYRGIVDALAEEGLSIHRDALFIGYEHQEGGEAVGAKLAQMEDRPTAMIATEDLIACGIIRSCQAHGLHVPEGMSVVGFDDTQPSRLISPQLTTVAQSVKQKATCAVEMLLDAIEHPEDKEKSITLDVHLIERESVARI